LRANYDRQRGRIRFLICAATPMMPSKGRSAGMRSLEREASVLLQNPDDLFFRNARRALTNR
jgi:hypothetical protein